MEKLKLFGCHEYFSGAKIISFISLVENLVKIAISVMFLIWVGRKEENDDLQKGKKSEISETKLLNNKIIGRQK